VDKISLEILGISASHSQNNTYTLVLSETQGNRRLPIVIGAFEAQAIVFELENYGRIRPMTHDLMVTIIQELQADLEEVVISDLKDGVFFAKLIFKHLGRNIEFDSRPSDAIAIAVRFHAPIYAMESVMNDAGIKMKEDEGAEFKSVTESTSSHKTEEEKQSLIQRMTQQIEEAIANEDYERAARLRDEIKKLES